MRTSRPTYINLAIAIPGWCKKFVNQPVLTATVPPSSLNPPPPNPLQPCGAGQWLRPNFHQDRVALPRTSCRRHRRGPAQPAGWDAPPTPCRGGFGGSSSVEKQGDNNDWWVSKIKHGAFVFWSQLSRLSSRSNCNFRFKSNFKHNFWVENKWQKLVRP